MPATSLLSCEDFRLACLAREGVAEVTRLLARRPSGPTLSSWPPDWSSPTHAPCWHLADIMPTMSMSAYRGTADISDLRSADITRPRPERTFHGSCT